MEDRILRQLQHHLKVYCKKGGCYGRQALFVGKECTAEMCFLDEWTWYMTYYQHIKKVFRCFCKTSLYTKVEKCKFHSKSVKYLG